MDIRYDRATAVVLSGIGAFQALLAGGAPWGTASWDGKHSGVLPDHLRAVSGAGAIAYVSTTCAATTALAWTSRRQPADAPRPRARRSTPTWSEAQLPPWRQANAR